MNGIQQLQDSMKRIDTHGRRPTLLIRAIYLLILIAALSFLAWNGLVGQFNASLSDVLLRVRGPVHSRTVNDIVLVAIDDTTAARYGPLPLRRSVLAQGIARLASLGPKVLVIDLLLAESGRAEDDTALATSFSSLPSVVLGAALPTDQQTPPSWILPLPEFAASHLIGHVHADPDADGNVRLILLEKSGAGKRYWALGLQAVRADIGAATPLETRESLELGSIHIPAKDSADRLMLINYAGPEGTFRRVRFSSLLDGTARTEDFRNKIAFLGVTAQGSGDRLFTPFSSGIGMSGIEIHANVARTILDRDFLVPLSEAGELTALALIGGVCALSIRVLRGIRLSGALVLMGALIVAASFVALHLGEVWPVGTMLVGLVVSGSIVGVGEYALVATALRKSERNQREYAFRVQAIAHEIKTPLTAIQGSSEIISDHLVPDEQRTQIAGMIHKESKKLTQLIHTFLDVERMATGSLALEKQQLDLAPLCQDLLERAQLYAARKKITISADVPHVTVAADGDLLSFAIYNLLTNAIKYSPKQTTVSLTAVEQGDAVLISVVDQGFGIAAAEQRKIFERFYRVGRGQAASEEGTGIGLALVKEIVSQHGGRVEVDSREGAGSRFTIVLPKQN
jgi:signal transduction histidine kinase